MNEVGLWAFQVSESIDSVIFILAAAGIITASHFIFKAFLSSQETK